MGENEHVAMDTEWCAANPDIACDLIAKMEAEVARLTGILAPIGRRLEARIEDAADAVLRAEKAEAALTQATARIAALTEEVAKLIRWRSLAQECTPGGSEYMDPNVVREVFQHNKREKAEAKLEMARQRKRAERAEAALATARADALEEAARVVDDFWPFEPDADFAAKRPDEGEAIQAAYDRAKAIAAAIRALALTQPASTQTLTDQGETSTAGDVG